jgi:F0F1-type ATP synthase epsilon subunit
MTDGFLITKKTALLILQQGNILPREIDIDEELTQLKRDKDNAVDTDQQQQRSLKLLEQQGVNDSALDNN